MKAAALRLKAWRRFLDGFDYWPHKCFRVVLRHLPRRVSFSIGSLHVNGCWGVRETPEWVVRFIEEPAEASVA